jgi:hypothetical protein
MALMMACIVLVACGSDDHSKSVAETKSSEMTKPKIEPAIITALAEKAYLVRKVAADQGVEYEETPVLGKDQITFSFRNLDRAGADKLALAMPKEVFAKRAYVGGALPPDVSEKPE